MYNIQHLIIDLVLVLVIQKGTDNLRRIPIKKMIEILEAN